MTDPTGPKDPGPAPVPPPRRDPGPQDPAPEDPGPRDPGPPRPSLRDPGPGGYAAEFDYPEDPDYTPAGRDPGPPVGLGVPFAPPQAPPQPPPQPPGGGDGAGPAGPGGYPDADAAADVPRPPGAGPDPSAARSVGIWGAPSSGKTTYLGAVRIAVANSSGKWRIESVDSESTDFLARTTFQLTDKREFPDATNTANKLSWKLYGTRTRVQKRGWLRSPLVTKEVSDVTLELWDPPGRIFGEAEAAQQTARRELGLTDAESSSEMIIKHLAGCRGLIFLFDATRQNEPDPDRKGRNLESFSFFQRTVLALGQYNTRPSNDHFLPHHLAVCITKYDHPYVRNIARREGLETDFDMASLAPRVPGDMAKLLFDKLCEDRVSNAELLRKEIETHFNPDRVRYFVTSAVGFYLDPRTGVFSNDDYSNLVQFQDPKTKRTKMRLKGTPYPINVLEPLVWLLDELPDEGRDGTA